MRTKRNRRMILRMACLAYIANRHYREDGIRLPGGYKRTAILENRNGRRSGFIAESGSRIVIAFRGTVDWGDLRKDLSATQVPFPYSSRGIFTHRGFTELYRALRPSLLEALSRTRYNKPVYVTGHSLGGALAALCALDLASRRKGPVRLYTFGAPKAGNGAFAEAVRSLTTSSYRIYNTKDLIPDLPPGSFLAYRYEHAGTPVPLTFQYRNPLSNHRLVSYIRALSAGWRTGCRAAAAGSASVRR